MSLSWKINDLGQTVLADFFFLNLQIGAPDRQQAHYNAVENDIAQGAEDQGIPEEEGGGKTP